MLTNVDRQGLGRQPVEARGLLGPEGHLTSEFPVSVHSEPDVAVADASLDQLRVRPGLDVERDEGPAEVVEPDPLDPEFLQRGLASWWRGWLRVAVVAYVLIWPAAWLWWSQQSARDQWLILEHLNPIFAVGRVLQPDRWCAVIATPEFLRRPVPERERLAAAFFDQEIAPLLGDLYYKPEPFRQDFIRAATLPLEEMPVKAWWNDSKVWPGNRPYRDVTEHAFPKRDLLRLSRDATGVALVVHILILLPTIAIASAIRWIKRGFKPT